MALYEVSKYANNTINAPTGIWWNNQMYCVWTKDRTDKEIEETDYHEMCHELVYRDWEHFCSTIYE